MFNLLILALAVTIYIFNEGISQLSYNLQHIIFLTSTLFLGVPHGAADLLVARNTALSRNKKFSPLFFFGEYLGLIFIFAATIYFFPLLGNLIFILLAAYHFGESDLNKFNIKEVRGSIFQIIYGIFIIAIILFTHWEETNAMISMIASGPSQQIILTYIGKKTNAILVMLSCSMFISSYFFLSLSKLSLKDKIEFWVCTIGIGLILFKLPLLLGFTAYFVLWHSLRSMYDIVSYLRKIRLVKLNRIIYEMAFYSLLAMLGVTIIGFLTYGYASTKSLELYVFWGLAVLTAPHMRVMHEMRIAADDLA